jgi:minor extracellular serine protease Vpr
MRRSRSTIGPAVLVIAMVVAMAGPVSAGSGQPVEADRPPPWALDGHGAPGEFVDDLWFVEFEAAPSARGGSPAAQANERARFRRDAAAEGAEITVERDFRTLWNGVTVQATGADITAVRDLRGVTAVYPVAVIEQPDPSEASPDMAAALEMTGAGAARSELGFTGEGLSIAIIDTGIDYNHPDLGGDGDADRRLQAASDRRLDHPRISHGWDYVGAEFNPADPAAPADPAPDPDPLDTQGHGTHVAGIAGADAAEVNGVTGVAPGVVFGAYKVFGPGSTSADVIVDALEDAYTDGMDIVNMSLGAAFVWGQDYPTSRVSNELAELGVVVVNSAGNSGGDGLWTLSAPANAHDIISVASADNTEQLTNVFAVEQLDDTIPYLNMSDAPAPPRDGVSDPLVAAGRGCVDTGSAEDDVLDPDHGDLSGSTALLVRGLCTFQQKYQGAVAAGATGVIIYNNGAGLFAGGGITATDDVWAAAISDSNGAALLEVLDEETVTLEFTDDSVSTPNPTGGLVSSFSSFGQEVELEFGPSVMAPGGLITSTYPLASGGYAMLSGTSMAAPHVAGAVALLLEAEGDLDPIAVRDRLQNTAEPAPWSLNPGVGLLDHTFRQGAGMIQIDRAILTEQHVTPGQIAVGDGLDSVDTSVTVSNTTDEDVTYRIDHEFGLEVVGSTFAPTYWLAGAEVQTPGEVTVPSGGSTEVELSITPPPSQQANHQYGGYVTMTPTDDGLATLRVPYAGFAGDYAGEMGLLGYWADATEFVEVDPVLAEITADGYDVVGAGHVFDVRQGDVPVIAPFFGHYPERMEVHAINQRSGRRLLALEGDHLRRSPQPGQRQAFPWSGRVQAGSGDDTRTVPSGTYTLEMRVLRANGDANEPAHWDTWESEPFELTSRSSPPRRGGSRP